MHWADAFKIAQIILIDIVLSGDNAVVIALAAHKLPVHLRRRAILWGGGIAIGMRIVFTMLMAVLLMIPGLGLLGGLVLVWIACKLLMGEEEDEVTADTAERSMLSAIRMIFLADFVMSLDNMLAVAGASHGNAGLLLMGLLVSIGIIMTCSALIAQLMNRFHWIVYVGAGILAWTAGEMITGDRELASYVVRSHRVSLSSHWDDWMETHGHVSGFAGRESLPDDLRDVVQFAPARSGARGTLTFIGQMTPTQRDELLSRTAADDRAEIERMYELARERDVPGWIPDGIREHASLWFQSRWPADYSKGIEGRYPWVAVIVQSAVVVFCLLAPRALRRHRNEEAAPPAGEMVSSIAEQETV